MKQKLNKITSVILFCMIFILSSCVRDELPIDNTMINQEAQIVGAKNWFEDYKAKEVFHPIFADINYHWEDASITVLEDGSKAVTVPITDINSNPEYKGERVLYLYPFEENYDAIVYELNPDSNQTQKSEGFKNLESYNGYISTWDLKKGFIKGQKFANSTAIKAVVFKVVSDEELKLHKSTSKIIDLDEVIIEGPGGGGGDYLYYSYVLSGGSFGSNSIGGSNTDNYFNPPHGGGGNSSSSTTPSIDDEEQDPCSKIRELLNNPAFKAKLDALKLKTSLTQENGFSQNRNGIFTTLTANGSDAVTIPRNVNTVGYMHTHLDTYDKMNADGDLEPVTPIKMFSPEDVRQFLILVLNAQNNNIPISDVYGVVVSSTGTYQLKFTGNPAYINARNSSINWGRLDGSYSRYLRGDIESGFLKFIKDKIGIDGIELYKMEAAGSFRKTLDSTGKITTINCN